MLWLLLRLRLAALFSNTLAGKKKRRTLPLIILFGILLLYAVVTFLSLFFMIFAVLLPPLEAEGARYVLFALGGTLAFLLMVVGSVIFTKNQLYTASDNEFLLAMPIPPRTILFSRLIFLLIVNYLFEAIVAVPLLLATLLFSTAGALELLALLLGLLLLPLLAQAVSALLAYLIARIAARIRHKSVLTLLVSLLLFGAYFFFMFGLGGFTDSMLEDVTPLIAFVQSATPLALFGRALSGEALPLVGLIVLILAASAGVFFWLSHTFLHTVLENRGERRIAYREKRERHRSPLMALTVRELRHVGSSAGYMLNAGLGLLFLVAVPIWLLIDPSLTEVLISLGEPFPSLLPAIGGTIGMFSCSMIIFSASSVSLEGHSLWIVRTAPVPTRTVLLSKILYHLVPTVPCALVAGIVLSLALRCSFPVAILLVLVLLAAAVFSATFGLAANLFLPKLEWKNELVPVKQGGATVVAMFGGMLVASLSGTAAVLLSFIAPWLGLLAALFILLCLTGALLVGILTLGVRQFEAL